MRIRRIVVGVVLPVLVAATVWGIAKGNAASARWGSDGHRMAARAAHDILPEEMPIFFREAGKPQNPKTPQI